MANRVTKTPFLRPGQYAAQLAKALEDEAKAKNRSGHKDAARCESKSSRLTTIEPESHIRSKFTHQSNRDTELVDSSDRLNESMTHANRRLSEQVKQDPFITLSEREKRMEGGREREKKPTKRLLKRGLAREIETLQSEVEDLKQRVIALQPLLYERSRGKRVTFQDELS